MGSNSPDHVSTFQDPAVVRRAKRALSQADDHMAAIIRAVGPFKPDLVKNLLEALVLSVIHQQLSMKAARTIAGRVRDLCPRRRLTAGALHGLAESELRSAGLSKQKVQYVKSICAHSQNGVINRARLKRCSDQQVVEALVDIKGVGVWTAEMILMFSLQRVDVWPVDDLGLRNALRKWYRIPEKAKRERLVAIGRRFQPYRSIATWYLWRSLGGDIVPGFK